MDISIDRSKSFQTMRGFGASGAWWAQSVGGWDSGDGELKTKDRISRLLYSETEGIGLGIYRYNLGSGSARSGRGSYSDPLRRADSFETESGYDFSRDAAAVYMMKKAAEDGADEIVLFVNSPPETLTKNGMGHLGKYEVFRTNLSKKNIPAFCTYCLDAAEHFISEGVPVKYISPVNEPLWIWNGGQEGCHYSPLQVRRVLAYFVKEMKKRPALSGVKLAGAENGDIRWFNKAYTRAVLGSRAVRELTDGIDIHSYCLPAPFPFLNDRTAFIKRYRKWLDRRYPGVPVNVSEWTHMKGGRDGGMDSALEQARVMTEDLTGLNACSWQHWIACSPYDYCDGLLYIDCEKQTFERTKRYYAFGNFSRFVKKGAVRVAAECDDGDILISAYCKDGRTAVVLVNPTDEDKTLRLPVPTESFVTSANDDLKKYTYPAGTQAAVPKKSVCTFIFTD